MNRDLCNQIWFFC